MSQWFIERIERIGGSSVECLHGKVSYFRVQVTPKGPALALSALV